MQEETSKFKETFQTLSEQLEKSGMALNVSFEEKQITLKTMCATFFAKMEVLAAKSGKELAILHKHFEGIESSFINPAKVVDAKFYSINQKLADIEQVSSQ